MPSLFPLPSSFFLPPSPFPCLPIHLLRRRRRLTLEERAARIRAERQERSRPLLNDFHTWLESEAPKVLPRSDARGARDYTLNNWAALSIYPEDG
jgi:hypothetical protein